jgi:hypothetical protein
VNIPVKMMMPGTHAIPWFMTESRYLSHGDDPYSTGLAATPPIPTSAILIDQATFDRWFGPAVDQTAQENNVARQIRELAVIHLPNFLLNAHCEDIRARNTRAESKVFDSLQGGLNIPYFTVAELEAMNLWTRLDAKIAAFGGCRRF